MSYRQTKENNTGNHRAIFQGNIHNKSAVHQVHPHQRRSIDINELQQRGFRPNMPHSPRHSNQGHLHVNQPVVYTDPRAQNLLRRSIDDYDNMMIHRSPARPNMGTSISQETSNIISSSNLVYDHLNRAHRAAAQGDHEKYRRPQEIVYRDYDRDGPQRHFSQNASSRYSLPNISTHPLMVYQPTERDQLATVFRDDSGHKPQDIRDERHSFPMSSVPYGNHIMIDNRQHNSSRPIETNNIECTTQPQYTIDIRPVSPMTSNSHQSSRLVKYSDEGRYLYEVPQSHVPVTVEECSRRNALNVHHAFPPNVRPNMQNTQKNLSYLPQSVVYSTTKEAQTAPVINFHPDQLRLAPKIQSRRGSIQLLNPHIEENQILARHLPQQPQNTHTRTIERDDNNQRLVINNNIPLPTVHQNISNSTNHDTRTANRFHPYGNHIAVDHIRNQNKTVKATSVNQFDQPSRHLDEEAPPLVISLSKPEKPRAPETITENSIYPNTQTENVSINNTKNQSLNSKECSMDTPCSPIHEQFSDIESTLHRSDVGVAPSKLLNKLEHGTPNECYTRNNESKVQDSGNSANNPNIAKNAFMLQMKDLFSKLDATVIKTDALMNSVQSKMVEFNDLFKNIIAVVNPKCEPINNTTHKQNNTTLQESKEKLTKKKDDKQNSSKNRYKCSDSDDNSDEKHFQSVKNKRGAIGKPKLDLPPEYDPSDHKYLWTLKHRQAGPGLKELVPSTGVYVDAIELTDCLQKSNSCFALARMLMEAIFTENALKVCTLTGVNVKNPELRIARPGLNLQARIVILTFVEEHGIRQKWKAIDTDSITNSMRNKLLEVRNRDK